MANRSISHGFHGTAKTIEWPIDLEVQKGCSKGTKRFTLTTEGYVTPFSYAVYPNPTIDEVTIEEIWNKGHPEQLIAINGRRKHAIVLPEREEFEVIIYNPTSEKIKEGRSHKGKLTWDIKKLEVGIYMIHIKKGKEIIKQKLIIER